MRATGETLREMARNAVDDAMAGEVKTLYTNLVSRLAVIQDYDTPTVATKATIVAQHTAGLKLCREAHDLAIAAVEEVFK